MQKKTTAIRLPQETREALEGWALQERRTLSSLIQIVLDDYVATRKAREAKKGK